MSAVDFITCHILDTSVGKPAANVTCQLFYVSPLLTELEDEAVYDMDAGASFAAAKTDQDGRVKKWTINPHIDSSTKDKVGISTNTGIWSELKPGIYKCKFLTGKYIHSFAQDVDAQLASRTFFPYVEITFHVSNPPDAHYHIPLLLSNYSYTTYRGS